MPKAQPTRSSLEERAERFAEQRLEHVDMLVRGIDAALGMAAKLKDELATEMAFLMGPDQRDRLLDRLMCPGGDLVKPEGYIGFGDSELHIDEAGIGYAGDGRS